MISMEIGSIEAAPLSQDKLESQTLNMNTNAAPAP